MKLTRTIFSYKSHLNPFVNCKWEQLMRMNEISHAFSVVYSKINFQLHGVWMGLTRFNEIDVNWTMFDQDIWSRVYDIDVLEWDLPR